MLCFYMYVCYTDLDFECAEVRANKYVDILMFSRLNQVFLVGLPIYSDTLYALQLDEYVKNMVKLCISNDKRDLYPTSFQEQC